MIKLTERQSKILKFIREKAEVSNREILEHLGNVSRITVIRDLNALLKSEIIKQKGRGRNVRYMEAVFNDLLRYIDVEEYFKKSPDERKEATERFNFAIFKKLKQIFSNDEIRDLGRLNSDYTKRIRKITPAILKKEWERLMIELSWKSSQIEGNTYSLLDTEVLIKERKEAEGHAKEEAIMILNHKKALDYILNKKSDFKNITLRKIESIHALVVADLGAGRGLRKRPVGIVGTRYRPIDNEYQIRDAMDEMIKTINRAKDPFSRTILAILLVSYIQPFEDGNKRTARLLGNAVLLAHNACPLSFRSINDVDYKKALIIFYEQNNLRFFKELFVEQFKFALSNYFLV